jgi:hypothetical protein
MFRHMTGHRLMQLDTVHEATHEHSDDQQHVDAYGSWIFLIGAVPHYQEYSVNTVGPNGPRFDEYVCPLVSNYIFLYVKRIGMIWHVWRCTICVVSESSISLKRMSSCQ